MFHQEFDPPEELQETIKCFWYTSRDFGENRSAFEVVPDGYAEIIFHFGGDCRIAKNGQVRLLPSPFLIGLLNHPVIFHAQNRMQIIGIRCFPWTVFDLLGLPPAKDGVRQFDHPIASLQPLLSRLVADGKTEEAVLALKEYFSTTDHSPTEPDSMLSKAGKAMSKGNGNLPVSRVAAAAHASVRSLERKFKQSSGFSVKDVSGLMRFERARNSLWTNPDAGLAALAVELGYTDQSHLSREFRRYSGTTPAAFARKAKKGQKLLSADFVAFIPANA